jgi:hypothetical protein
MSIGYIFVSGILLRRKRILQSRYGTIAQFMLLAFSSLPLSMRFFYLFGGDGGIVLCFVDSALAPVIYGGAILGYWAGLHFSYVEHSPLLQNFGIKWASPRSWFTCSTSEVLLGLLMCTLFVAFGVAVVAAASTTSITSAALYALFRIVAIVAVGAFLTFLVSKRYSAHVHHYIVALLILQLTSASLRDSAEQQPSAGVSFLGGVGSHSVMIVSVLAIALLHGLMLGAYVEGVAVWGFDPPLVALDAPLASKDLPTVVWLQLLSEMSAARKDASRAGLLSQSLQCMHDLMVPLFPASVGVKDSQEKKGRRRRSPPRGSDVDHSATPFSTPSNAIQNHRSYYSELLNAVEERLAQSLLKGALRYSSLLSERGASPSASLPYSSSTSRSSSIPLDEIEAFVTILCTSTSLLCGNLELIATLSPGSFSNPLDGRDTGIDSPSSYLSFVTSSGNPTPTLSNQTSGELSEAFWRIHARHRRVLYDVRCRLERKYTVSVFENKFNESAEKILSHLFPPSYRSKT